MHNMSNATAVVGGFVVIALLTLWTPLEAAVISLQQDGSEDGSGNQTGVTYSADSTYIRNDGGGPGSKNDNDAQDENIVGYNASSTSQLRGLFEFDLSPISSIAGSNPVEINGVELVLTSRGAGEAPGNTFTVSLFEYGFDFVEADATWNDPDGDGNPATGDTTAGGTLGTLLSTASFTPPSSLGDTTTLTTSAAFETAVADALAATLPVRLIAAKVGGTNEQSFARFYDESVATMGFRPELVVDFTVAAIPEPSTFALTALGLLSLGLVGWRRRNR